MISVCCRTPGAHSIGYVVCTEMTFLALLTARKHKDCRRRKNLEKECSKMFHKIMLTATYS